MLADKKQFEIVENELLKNGSIQRFENEYGEIKGRMMITVTEIPSGIEIDKKGDEEPIAFEVSFDFYDSVVGIALYTADREVATGIWVRSQKEGAEAPAEEWVEFFLKILLSNIAEDGSFGSPICSFVNDTADMTVVPTRPESEA